MRTAEFQLAVDCCRLAFDSGHIAASSRDGFDWERFYRLVHFHRVQGLVWKSLSTLEDKPPASVALRIAEDAARIAAANRVILDASRTLLTALRSEGIDFLILKGLPLGVLAYGSPWLKAGVDIDLLIDDARLSDALAVLRRCAYRREAGRPGDYAALRKWHCLRKDSEWAKDGSTARVDLHTRVTDNNHLIPSIGLQSPRQVVEVAGEPLPTLGTEELFAYLCVHGASSAWYRLKWITDLAALLAPKQWDAIERLYERSQELGAGRAAGQALLLADSLYGTLGQCPALRDKLCADPIVHWLFRGALKQLAGRPDPREPTAYPGGTVRIHLHQFLLMPSLSLAAYEFIRQARAAAASRT